MSFLTPRGLSTDVSRRPGSTVRRILEPESLLVNVGARRHRLRAFLCAATLSLPLLTAVSGCVGSRSRETVWRPTASHSTPHYLVLTDMDPDTASHVGVLMETAYGAYCVLAEILPDSTARFQVNVYASRKDYDREARCAGLTPQTPAAFFSPTPPAAIHALCVENMGAPSAAMLALEGFHQFAEHFLLFQTPKASNLNGASWPKDLPALPIWLTEGLAAYIEAAAGNGDGLKLGTPHQEHLAYLQYLIQSGNVPRLNDVLTRTYGQSFGPSEYAVSWGIVHVLMQVQEGADTQAGTRKLRAYIQTARRGFYDSPRNDFPHDFASYTSPELFLRAWYRRLGVTSLKAFEDLIVGRDATLQEWETRWHEAISRIAAQ